MHWGLIAYFASVCQRAGTPRLVLAILLIATSYADSNAQALRSVYSATWQFSGTCTGEDLWNKWTVTGQTASKDAHVRPWLDHEIDVIGYELVRLQHPFKISDEDRQRNAALSWFMVGSLIQPDAQIWLEPGSNRAREMWPPGFGQRWPTKSEAEKWTYGGMQVIHGTCWGGGPISIFMTIYYSPVQ